MEHNRNRDRDGVGVGTVIVISGFVSAFVSFAVIALLAVIFSLGDGSSLFGAQLDEVSVDEADWEDPDEGEHEPPTPVDADPSKVIEGTFPEGDRSPRLYRFQLPADAVYVRATLTAGDTDLDLRTAFGEDAAANEDWRVTADGPTGDEYAWSARHENPDFGRKPFMVQVDCYAEDEGDVDYTLELQVVTYESVGRLEPGQSVKGSVSLDTGHRVAYELLMPDGVDSLCIDVVDTRQDLDLAVGVGPLFDTGIGVASALTDIGRESLVLNRAELRLDKGDQVLSLVVVDRNYNDRLIPFEIHLSAGDRTPDEIRRLPELPIGRSDAEIAALSIVEISVGGGEGSGVVVGRDGRILTAAHVVEDVELDAPDVVISVTTDVALEPIELLRGRVIRSDEELDIAIIEITSTFHGDPIPAGWRLPSIPMRLRQPVVLGEAVHACGFPVLHDGTENAEVTWTTGVVCGFESPHGYQLVRTDAEISSGSSGGALLDDKHRLIGVTIAMHGDLSEFSATGLALPLSEIPAEWMDLLK